MKKAISLMMAAAMSLALAAPALAITGDTNPGSTNTKVAPYSGTFDLVTAPPADALGVLNLATIASNKTYIKSEMVYFRIKLNTPKADAISVDPSDYAAPAIQMTTDIGTFFAPVNIYTVTSSSITNSAQNGVLDNNNTTLLFDIFAPSAAAASYIITGSAVVTGSASGHLKMNILGDKNSPKFAQFGSIKNADIEGKAIYSNKTKQYILYTDANNFLVDIVSGTSSDYGMRFVTNNSSTSNVEAIQVKLDSATDWITYSPYAPSSSGGKVVDSFLAVDGTRYTADSADAANRNTFSALMGAYKEVMKFFGFDYNLKGVLMAGHFAMKMSTYFDTVSAAVKIGTGSVTIPDGNTPPPQTGDSATAVGFIMVALAVVGVAVVAIKKIRV